MDRVFAGEQVPEEGHDAILLAPSSEPRVLASWVIWPEAQRAFQSAASTTPLDGWWDGGGARMLVVQGLDDRVAPPGNGHPLAGRGKFSAIQCGLPTVFRLLGDSALVRAGRGPRP